MIQLYQKMNANSASLKMKMAYADAKIHVQEGASIIEGRALVMKL